MDFSHYWQYTDLITKSLFFVLLGLSVLSWVTGILRILQSRKLVTTISQTLSQQM